MFILFNFTFVNSFNNRQSWKQEVCFCTLIFLYSSLFYKLVWLSPKLEGGVWGMDKVQAFALWISFHCKCVEVKENTLGCGGDMLMGDLCSELSCLREILMLHGFVWKQQNEENITPLTGKQSSKGAPGLVFISPSATVSARLKGN